jgi:hypothetical protein
MKLKKEIKRRKEVKDIIIRDYDNAVWASNLERFVPKTTIGQIPEQKKPTMSELFNLYQSHLRKMYFNKLHSFINLVGSVCLCDVFRSQ